MFQQQPRHNPSDQTAPPTEDEQRTHAPPPSAAAPLTPARVVGLQRRIGNRAVQQLIQRQQAPANVIQRNPTERLAAIISDSEQAEHIRRAAQNILNVINALIGRDFETASTMLYSNDMARGLKHHINLKFVSIRGVGKSQSEIDKEVEQAIGKGMYFQGKLDLPAVMIDMGSDQDPIMPENDESLAMKVLPVVLEEWIHMFQHMIGGLLSENTEAFAATPEVQENQTLPEGGGKWNMREVDIYAIYRDLGWDTVLDAFRSRYTERQKFEDFMVQQEYGEQFQGSLGHGMEKRLARGGNRKGK